MNKDAFIAALQKRLSGFPADEVGERLAFYSEMIDDRIEDGYTEEEAVASIGTVEEIAAQIIADMPLVRIVKERLHPKRRLTAFEIVLLVLGSPIWISLLVAVFSVLLSLYVTMWSVIASIWACFGALAGGALGGVALGVSLVCEGFLPTGLVLLGGALAAAGLSILTFFGCRYATLGGARLTKRLAVGFKRCFARKEASHG